MSIQDTQYWMDATDKIFDDYGYLLDESAIKITMNLEFCGPGGDWDFYEITIAGCDSGEEHQIFDFMDNGSFRLPFQPWDFAWELADYLAVSQGGRAEEDGYSIIITF